MWNVIRKLGSLILTIIFIYINHSHLLDKYFGSNQMIAAMVIDRQDAAIYLPNRSNKQPLPMVILFSPDGDGSKILNFWIEIAEKYKLIIFATKLYHNNMSEAEIAKLADVQYQLISQFSKEYPVQQNKLIFSGFSSGASFAYYMNFRYPGVADSLLVNNGAMSDFLYQYVYNEMNQVKSQYHKLPSVVMIASATDPLYPEMQRDKKMVDYLGWESRWLELEGGHKANLKAKYYQALDYLMTKSQ